MDLAGWLSTGREILRETRSQNIPFMAGSIAHSALLSLLPLLLLLLVVTTAVGNETLNQEIFRLARRYLSPVGEALLFEALTSASERAGASLIGVATLLWGMFRVFRGFNTAFEELYGVQEERMWDQLVDSVVVLTAIGVATVGTAFGVAVTTRLEHPIVVLLNQLVFIGGLMLAFYPLYYRFPAPPIPPREALPGTLIAAIGWVILEFAFSLYVEFINTISLYGFIGSILLLLVWLYGVAFILLLGAMANIVLADRHRDDSPDHPE